MEVMNGEDLSLDNILIGNDLENLFEEESTQETETPENETENNFKLVLLKEEGKCFSTNKIKIFQALNPGRALGTIEEENNLPVLLMDKEDKNGL